MNSDSIKIFKELSRYKEGTFGDTILRHSYLYRDREAFVFEKKRITFSHYNQRVNSLIAALTALGIKKGDVIGVFSWNCLEYSDAFGVAGKGGFILAPLNARASAKELEYLIQDSGAKAVFVGPEFTEVIINLKPKIPSVKHFISFEKRAEGMHYHDDLIKNYPSDEPGTELDLDTRALLLYTSGTTGVPKGALYTQGQIREDVRTHSLDVPLDIDNKGLFIMPPFHIGGVNWFYLFYYRGVCNIIMKTFDPKFALQLIEREKITSVAVVPTHLAAILALPELNDYDTSSLKNIKYVGSPMPTQILKQAISKWGSIFCQGYGQTEAGPDITFLAQKDHDVLDKSAREQQRLSSCGRPFMDVHVRIVDEKGQDVGVNEIGEIIVKSRHLMSEYWNKPKETAETIINGWLHTRDMGKYDEDGYIYIVDRKNDMIISGGENIYPREVEEVLYQHPAVLECAVFGIPDTKWVESVHAIVAFKQGKTATIEELMEFCKNNLARYKAPKSMEIMESLPKGGTGKILKKELRQKYWK